jgi:DNA-binding NtrC family response regulator
MRDATGAGAGTGAGVSANSAGAARILVVDDEPAIRRLLTFNLQRRGFRVDEAETGEAALAAIERRPCELVLLDMALPGISGMEVLRRIRQSGAGVPVIVLTAHGSVENAVEAMKLGAFDFLSKPIEMERLAIAVGHGIELGRLSRTVSDLRERLSSRRAFDQVVGTEGALRETVLLVEKVTPTDLTVLLQGESGTGKELFARAIHDEGPRRDKPFVAINGAALAETLLESELFGHERGAFTGADRMRRGKFELADGGTLFLDEIGEISPALQVKLLRAIQERVVTRVGGSDAIPVDVRIIAATNRDLVELVREGRFREDLYYRLSVFPVTIPPLRERRADIAHLVRHVLTEIRPERPPAVHSAVMERLEGHAWPGNVRELQNVLRRAVVLAGEDTIRVEHLPAAFVGAADGRADAIAERSASGTREKTDPHALATLEEMERCHIERAIAACDGNLSLAARVLGIGRTTLYRKLEQYGEPVSA